jgi:LmbE family N-acetylglucosaminyl deacetylase
MKTILIVSPHGDDELLGMGGYIINEIQKGNKVHVMFGTDGMNEENSKLRISEIKSVSKFIGFTYEIMYHNMDGTLYQIPKNDIVNKIDKKINELKPDEFYCCYPSHHQDHAYIYECGKAAMRLKEGWIPKVYGLYEYIFVDPLSLPQGGLLYIDIGNSINKKLEAFKLYKSQNKQSPSPLTIESVKTLAKMRGMQCGKQYAELIYIQKLIL